jgi:Asp-tRNA(Asn)/Glu-tRNA(Gln) amidotransferase A subunit family amidase
MPALHYLSASAMAALVRTRQISPTELVEAHLARIERVNLSLNAFVQVDAEGARRQALNCADGPLHGVPLTVKSCIDVAGLRCEAGTRLRANVVVKEDAPLVKRLREAGAIILGTTNCPELLMAWETDNTLYGRTNNPWDLSRTAGGSSGGESAAIASGCSAGGVGSDGGGSIREPAHFTGICGLKPTPGRIPATGHYPNSVGPFALTGVVGPMARTIGDLKLLFAAMQGPDIGDPSAAPVPLRRPEEVRHLRVGYFDDDGRTPVTEETREAVHTAAKALQSAGFTVEPFQPEGLEQVRQLWWKYFGIAGGMLLRPLVAGHEDNLSAVLKEYLVWVAAEPAHTADSLLDMWIQRDLVRMRIFEQMKRYPILLCPVAAIPAFRHGERSWQIDDKIVKYLDAWSYTEWFNLLGNPAVTVPVSHSKEGLPIGVQLAARPWEDETLLSVAEALEKQLGEWKAPPLFA